MLGTTRPDACSGKDEGSSHMQWRARPLFRRSQLGGASAAFGVLENVSFRTAVISVSGGDALVPGVLHRRGAAKGMTQQTTDQ